MADKYPKISPYAYCAWNPVMLVDPDGMQHYTVDENGNVSAVKGQGVKDKFDVLFNKNDYYKGKREYDKSGTKNGIRIDKGEISNLITQTSDVTDDGNYLTGDKISRTSFEVKTKEIADNLHKFLDKNTVIEWSNQNFTAPDGRRVNVMATSYETGDYAKVSGINSLTKWYLDRGYTLNNDDHNHPHNYPHGYDISQERGDKGYKKDIKGYRNINGDTLGKNATFRRLWRGKFKTY